MIEIQLPEGSWQYDPSDQLGPEGGFGVVYRGESEEHGAIAVKKLKISAEEGGQRELDIASELSGHSFDYVIPFLDSGQDANSDGYFVVMPIADKSLEDEVGNAMDEHKAIKILLDIARGLNQAKAFVHRDLKPGNVLFHQNKWKLADFGIAKFVERATSRNTLKDCLTPHYAAPEQWSNEKSTNATDIYALGCVAFELLSGDIPFAGPDFKENHLHSAPPDLECSSKLATLVRMMLRKPPASRPKIQRVISLLEDAASAEMEPSAASLELAAAGEAVEKQRAKEEAERLAYQTAIQSRSDLAEHALNELSRITNQLSEFIDKSSPNVVRSGKASSRSLTLGGGKLLVQFENEVVDESEFASAGWDVVAYGALGVAQAAPKYNWWSSLWYTNLGKPECDYRWYEASYFTNPLVGQRHQFEPFQLASDFHSADLAHSATMSSVCVAFGPIAIDDEDEGSFFERWAKLFATAVSGDLRHPRTLPLN